MRIWMISFVFREIMRIWMICFGFRYTNFPEHHHPPRGECVGYGGEPPMAAPELKWMGSSCTSQFSFVCKKGKQTK